MNLHFHGHRPRSEELRANVVELAEDLEMDFPNLVDCDLSLDDSVHGFRARLRILGRGVRIAAHAECPDMEDALRTAFGRAYRQLRKQRDRRIDTRRWEARREHHAL